MVVERVQPEPRLKVETRRQSLIETTRKALATAPPARRERAAYVGCGRFADARSGASKVFANTLLACGCDGRIARATSSGLQGVVLGGGRAASRV